MKIFNLIDLQLLHKADDCQKSNDAAAIHKIASIRVDHTVWQEIENIRFPSHGSRFMCAFYALHCTIYNASYKPKRICVLIFRKWVFVSKEVRTEFTNYVKLLFTLTFGVMPFANPKNKCCQFRWISLRVTLHRGLYLLLLLKGTKKKSFACRL